MKKTITKIWGIGLVVMLLASLLIVAAPVSAGTNAWSAENAQNVNIISANQIVDIANYGNGSTLYAATGGGNIYKSTNGGAGWGPPIATGGAAIDRVVVAPDDPNVVVAVDTAATKVYLSTNGATFADITPPLILAVADVTIAPLQNGIRRIVACGADAGGGAVHIFNLGATIPAWTTIDGNAGVLASIFVASVEFSPNFLSDLALTAVSTNALAAGSNANLQVYSFNTDTWNAASYFSVGYPVALETGALNTTGGLRAEISIDPNYLGYDETMRNIFVAITTKSVVPDGGVYRVVDTVSTPIYATNAIYSVAYDGSTLVVGRADSNVVMRSTNPFVGGLALANMTNKGPGGAGTTNTVVTWAGDNVLAATLGANSAVALSRDGGQTFNDVAWVNTAIASASDLVFIDDGARKYYVTDDGVTTTSVWRKGTTWERILTVGTVPYIIGVAPENSDVIYLGRVGANTMYYSSTAGNGRWYLRNSSVVIQDMAVESASNVYVLSGAGVVAKTDNGGYIWNNTGATPLGGTGYSLELVSTDVLMVGGTNGRAGITTNGGTSWRGGPSGVAGNVVLTADENYADNNIIYAGGNTVASTVGRGTVSATRITWANLGSPQPGTEGIYGLASQGGVLYALSVDPPVGTNTGSLWQYVANTWQNAAQAVDLGIGSNMGNALIQTSGNQLWSFINATGAIYSITDVIGVTIPALATPSVDASIQSTNNIIFSIGAVSNAATYNIVIAYDSAFTQPVNAAPIVLAAPALNVVVGPNGLGATLINWQPGSTYYWRARAVLPFASPWSGTRSLSIQPGAALVPNIGAPVNGATIESTTPSFSWTPVAATTQYQFQLSADPAFSSLVYSTSTMTTAVKVPAALTEGETYFWRVRALLPVTADWSTVANFTVAVPAPPPPATETETETLTPPAPTTATVTMPVTLTIPPAAPATTTVVTVSVPAPQQPTTVTFTVPAPEVAPDITPSYIWAIIIIGAVLVIAVIVLIVRTRRSV